MLKNSIVAMAFDRSSFAQCAVAVVNDIHSRESTIAALTELGQQFDQPIGHLDADKHVGLILSDGLSVGEERVMEVLGDQCNISFVGGSSGDDVQFKSSSVFADGKAYSGACILALLKPAVAFEIVKTQSFEVTGQCLDVTDVDEAKRTVLTFNGQPAVNAYAEVLGVDVDKLPDQFMTHPLGLMVTTQEPYVRSPQQVSGQSVVFYCRIQQGMQLRVLNARNIVTDTSTALQQVLSKGPVSALINFHCILRTLELEAKGQMQAYGELFSNIPTIGFSTYGEAYIGHINQTSTMLVLR
jgi:hypothetical protein